VKGKLHKPWVERAQMGSLWWDLGGNRESDDDDRERCEFCKLGSLTTSATTTVSATSAESTTSFL